MRRLAVKSRLNATVREERLDIFLATCRWVRIYYQWRPNLNPLGGARPNPAQIS
jgi:hypothetical protein